MIGLVSAVTAAGLVGPLSERDWQDIVPSRGREGYVVSPKSSERVVVVVIGGKESVPHPRSTQGLPDEVSEGGVDLFVLEVDVVGGEDGVAIVSRVLFNGTFPVPGVPCPDGEVGVIRVASGASIRSIAPWVSVLGTPYVPLRGPWVLRPGCRGVTTVGPLGLVSGWDLLPTRVVLVVGGIPNRDRSLVKGTGGGCRANRCQIRADSWSSSLEAGDNIVGWEWCVSPVGPWDSSSSKKSDSLQITADFLHVDECEDEGGDEGGGDGNGNAYAN